MISQYDYTYGSDRSIATWAVEQGGGAKTWTFGYNGSRELTQAALRDGSQSLLESRRVRIKELTSSVETKHETFVWCGARICQKRASNGSTVVRSYFGQGFEEDGTDDYFYTRDHLGSVREVVASDGTTVASRVSYDPWGKLTETGSVLSDFAFTDHYLDRPTGLSFTWYRAYDTHLGRWLSLDPIGLDGGWNLYGYVSNNPANLIDADGLSPTPPCTYKGPSCASEKAAWDAGCDRGARRIYHACRAAGKDPGTCEWVRDIQAADCKSKFQCSLPPGK